MSVKIFQVVCVCVVEVSESIVLRHLNISIGGNPALSIRQSNALECLQLLLERKVGPWHWIYFGWWAESQKSFKSRWCRQMQMTFFEVFKGCPKNMPRICSFTEGRSNEAHGSTHCQAKATSTEGGAAMTPEATDAAQLVFSIMGTFSRSKLKVRIEGKRMKHTRCFSPALPSLLPLLLIVVIVLLSLLFLQFFLFACLSFLVFW